MSEFMVVEVGPIWSHNDYVNRTGEWANAQPGWELSGAWWTTVPSTMSVVQYRKVVAPAPEPMVQFEVEICNSGQYEVELEVANGVELEVEIDMNTDMPTPCYDLVATDGWEQWGQGMHVPATGWFAQFGEKAQVDFDDLQCDVNGVLSGSGSDPVGSFYLTGKMDNANWFTFVKQYYGAHQVMYRGRLVKGVMSGKWEIPGNCDGTFNIMPGWQRWKGGFWFSGDFTEMVIDEMYIGSGGVKGRGSDDVGAFVCQGYTNGDQVSFAKTYVGAHTVFYNGQWEGKSVVGRWQIPGNCDGTFRLQAMRA